jgi:hypothetical protein
MPDTRRGVRLFKYMKPVRLPSYFASLLLLPAQAVVFPLLLTVLQIFIFFICFLFFGRGRSLISIPTRFPVPLLWNR